MSRQRRSSSQMIKRFGFLSSGRDLCRAVSSGFWFLFGFCVLLFLDVFDGCLIPAEIVGVCRYGRAR